MMEIQWYGHSSFLLTTAKGVQIIMDPYEPGAFDGGIMYGPITDKADIVLVSHDHADHNYVTGLRGSPQVIKTAGRHEAKGIVIEGIPSFHDASRGSERGENIIFIVVADGMRVCHLGDLGHRLSDKEVKAIGQVDCLLIPIGGFYTIDPQEATAVAEQLSPKLLIPMHWKTEKCGFPIEPVAPFLKGKKSVRKIKGSSFSFTKKELAAGLGVVVLQPAL
jgi:L-ascorbate metabolism protein UlaG (beta-lactamase superfamily)